MSSTNTETKREENVEEKEKKSFSTIKRKFVDKKKRSLKISCTFCKDKTKKEIKKIHFFNIEFLKNFLNEKDMIKNYKKNNLCRKHQRLVRKTIIVSRHLHLLKYISIV